MTMAEVRAMTYRDIRAMNEVLLDEDRARRSNARKRGRA
jgi:hypothetical protein